uniref:Uncharacterized protein n=1 Tax=Biomphalaria glabrata TaxID=6526 RepID=A0A2C9LNL4_BIOGL
MASPHRPKFWPNSNVPYPSYELKKKESLRYGSGEVYNVIKFLDGIGQDVRGHKFFRQYSNCVCPKCSLVHSHGHSGASSSVWWEIIIRTATHVVFDDIEAEHTKCKLYYDEQNHPGTILENFSVYDQTIETDSFLLKLVVCEGDLGDELFAKRKHCRELWSKVCTKYRNSETKLCFIVSHPHGCPKQVSIGEWLTSVKKREYSKDYDLTKLTYNTCTCPGSSGAYVHSIGLGGSHVHTGCKGYGINFSGHGIQIKK